MKYTICCGDLCAVLHEKEIREVEYLARWHADLQYIKERFGPDDPECIVSRKSIEASFHALDEMGVPHWMQNAALAFSEDWRRYKSMSIWDYIKNRSGYYLEAVTA